MHKVKEHLEKLECFQSELICCMEEKKDDCSAVSMISDIVKDIASAMKDEAEASYYKCLAEEMHKEKEEEELMMKLGIAQNDDNESMGYSRGSRGGRRSGSRGTGSMGYDNYRYASGRFAPKGKGHYAGHSGYTPNGMPMIGEMDNYFEGIEVYDPTRLDMAPMGYGSNGRGNSSSGSNSNSGSSRGGNSGSSGNYGYGDGRSMNQSSQYGRTYDNYLDSRRHYTETKDEKDKEMMRHDAKEHMHGVEHTIKDIWKDADPSLKKELKTQMESLVNEMRV